MQHCEVLLLILLFLFGFSVSVLLTTSDIEDRDETVPQIQSRHSYEDDITLSAAERVSFDSASDNSSIDDSDFDQISSKESKIENFILTGNFRHIRAGVVSNFSIHPINGHGDSVSTGDLQLLLRHNMSEKHSKFVTFCEEYYCIVHFLCIEAGDYFISLIMDDYVVNGSPFLITVHPGPMNASRTFAMAMDSKGKPVHPLVRKTDDGQFISWTWIAGEANIFTINPRDSYGNKVFSFKHNRLSFSHNLSASAPLKMKSESLSDGRLKVIANTTTAVSFQLSIAYENIPILNSPIEITVKPSEVCSECSLVQGTGLIDNVVGKQSEIIIGVRDKWFNLNPDGFLSATCHSPNCSIAIENHFDGRFSILFTPYKKEIIQLSIRVNGFPITGSPFSTQVKAKEFPLPPLLWKFLGPFAWEQCDEGKSSAPLHNWGLCDYENFKNKISVDDKKVYPSTLMVEGKVSWRTTVINATGHSRIKTGGTEFFGWAIGNFSVRSSGMYNVFCGGIYEYYIKDIRFSGGSWHPIILEKGGHSITLLLTSDKGVGDYYCDFMPVVEETNWPVESLIDVSSLPGDQSWFAIIQLVILFKCLQAIVGPLYYNPEQVNG